MTATRYEITQGREVRAWGLSHRDAQAQLRDVAAHWLAGQEPIVEGIPGHVRIVDDRIAEDGELHLAVRGVWGNMGEDHYQTWRIREDGGAATHPTRPAVAPLTRSAGQLDRAAVAARYGIQPDSVTAAVNRGSLPPPDGYVGRSPWWWESTLDAHQRPGRGAGGGRPPRLPASG